MSTYPPRFTYDQKISKSQVINIYFIKGMKRGNRLFKSPSFSIENHSKKYLKTKSSLFFGKNFYVYFRNDETGTTPFPCLRT